MGNKKATKRLTVRRAATFLAALGALVMSSGIALMVTATPANAAQGPSVCHPVNGAGELGNGWNLIPPDKASSHIDDALFPDGEYWKHTSNDGRHDVYADEENNCPGEIVEPVVATASVTPIQPTCDNGNVADYSTSGDNVEFSESAAPAPGTSITVTATATGDAEFEGGATSKDFVLDFDAAADCTVVSPPTTPNTTVKPPKKHPTETVTPTVVHAGLAGVSSEDMRSEQGLALMFAGMLMLVAAGGLGLRVRGSESRI